MKGCGYHALKLSFVASKTQMSHSYISMRFIFIPGTNQSFKSPFDFHSISQINVDQSVWRKWENEVMKLKYVMLSSSEK